MRYWHITIKVSASLIEDKLCGGRSGANRLCGGQTTNFDANTILDTEQP